MGEATTTTDARGLTDLARSYGVLTSYTDLTGVERAASVEALLAVVRALGAPVERIEDVDDALREREARALERIVEPVVVLWEGDPAEVRLRLSGDELGRRVDCRLETEDGRIQEWAGEGPVVRLPIEPPLGYHDLTVRVAGRAGACRLIVAPPTAHDPRRRAWGAFLPLYALRTRRTAGVADFGDLEALLEWTAARGGSVVGTLPLFAAFLSRPFDPSPYAPVSRLFWNELFVDLERAPELERSSEAQAALDAARPRLRALCRSRLVDYRRVAALKRDVGERLAREFWAGSEWGSEAFTRFLATNPTAREYAAFRAACEGRAGAWPTWPEGLRDGPLREGHYDDAAARYHLYAQWLAHRQLDALVERTGRRGAGLYLDLPLGVHPDGYDAWRWKGLFAEGAASGAPPDDFFAGGQDWGFRPLHPEKIREDGYRYLAACLRALFRHADVVRLDHVMGLHRLFWVPTGLGAMDGVYVRYRQDELYAVLCLESRRHRTALVGEDLGTVPPGVREALEEHGIRRMVVLPFELRDGPALAPVPERSAASIGTHDMPPFAGWWEGLDPGRRAAFAEALRREGFLAPDAFQGVPESQRPRPILEAALERFAASPARLAVVNLEDLWLETRPQNEPGTTMDERPNWRRKARYMLETFADMPEVVEPLARVAARRDPAPTRDEEVER